MATHKAKKIVKKKVSAPKKMLRMAAKKPGAKKSAAKKAVVKKSVAKKKSAPKKVSVKKTLVKKVSAKKAPVTKATAKSKIVRREAATPPVVARKNLGAKSAANKSVATKSPTKNSAKSRSVSAAPPTGRSKGILPVPRTSSARPVSSPVSPPPGPKKATEGAITISKASRATTKSRQPSAPPPKHQSGPELSAEAKKKLAAQHLWELVEKKKRQAAQVPTWQTIPHHDHPTPAGSPSAAPQDEGAISPRAAHEGGDPRDED
jgi:hypothetical protein